MTTKVASVCDGPNCSKQTYSNTSNDWLTVTLKYNTESSFAGHKVTYKDGVDYDFCSYKCLNDLTNTWLKEGKS